MARKDTYENYTRDDLIDTVLQLSIQVTNLELHAKKCSAQEGLAVDEKKITDQELDDMSIALSSSGILWGDRLISAIRTQEQAIGCLLGKNAAGKDALNKAQATISERDAVIAAMWQGINAAYTDVREQSLPRLKGRIVGLRTLAQDFAQLAADHDAAVRAPLEAKIAALQDWLSACIARSEDNLTADQMDSMNRLIADTQGHADAHTSCIRADERKRVSEKAARIVEQQLGLAHVRELGWQIRQLAAQPEEGK